MFSVAIDRFTVLCQSRDLPELYPDYVRHARLVEEVDLDGTEGAVCFVAVQEQLAWPLLVVALRYTPSVCGFHPGVALIPETGVLFIGAGERLLAYSVDPPQKLWEGRTDPGFWGWQRHGNFVLMAAELEFAAWDLSGKKLWSTFVEPPWDYTVRGDMVELDVMGQKSSFALAIGPLP